MIARLIASAVLVVASTLPAAALADEGEHHDHHAMSAERLGTVHFPVTAKKPVQKDFDRAVALLHSFQYVAADSAFNAIARKDPTCAMAYWGVAMSNYHPLWAPPDSVEFARGSAAALLAVVGGRGTRGSGGVPNRERAYIDAISAFYDSAHGKNYMARKRAYEFRMERLHEDYPDDTEGAIFYALSLISTASPKDKTFANQKKAAGILNAILPSQENHPGIAHYLIHSLDYPELATLALPAARAYAKIAPSAPHALHMPSHIFTRLGFWNESIRSNLASEAQARVIGAKLGPDGVHFDGLHAMDYLEYAYLQLGDDARARGTLDTMRAARKVDIPSLSAAYAIASIPARYALERHDWKAAAGLSREQAWFPWARYPQAEAITIAARAVGAARSGNPGAARAELGRLDSLRTALSGMTLDYDWGGQVAIWSREASGWIARAEGKDAEAVAALTGAADTEDASAKHPVTPGAALPAREMLGDLLLELGKPAEARAAYERCLGDSPGRLNSLYGLARCAEAMGDRVAAEKTYRMIADNCAKGAERAEVAKAREFVEAAK